MEHLSPSRLAATLLCLCLLACCACARAKPEPEAPVPAIQPAAGIDPALEDAKSCFLTGDVKRAVSIIENILAATDRPDTKACAQFMLASIKLAASESKEDFRNALSLWEAWEISGVPASGCEDPRLLRSLLRYGKEHVVVREVQVRTQIKPGAGSGECAEKLAEKDREIVRLRQKLKAIEDITREMQEKKKGLSNQ